MTTYDDAKEIFDSRNLVLLTPESEFNNIKLTKTKLKCSCKIHTDEIMYHFCTVVKSGRFSCKKCSKEVGRKDLTIEERLQIIEDAGYKYISGDLSRMLSVLELECAHGHSCKGSLQNIKNKNDICYECKGTTPPGYWNFDTISEWMKNDDIFKDYKLLKFENNQDGKYRVLLKCPVDTHPEYWTNFTHIIRGHTECRECYYDKNNKINWDIDKTKTLFREYGYEIIDDEMYIASHTRVPCKDKYGFIYMVNINYLTHDRTSFCLLKGNPYAVDNIKTFCELYRPDYIFLDKKYKGMKTEYNFKYIGDDLDDNIDRVFKTTLDGFMNRYCGHPVLSMSRLEQKCQQILEKYSIPYETQKTFDGCIYKNKLRFDFYCVINNKEYCIETDGTQHEKPVEKFGGEEAFIQQQIKDEIKNNYCEQHKINLIRIPEREFKNMEEILVKELDLKGGGMCE